MKHLYQIIKSTTCCGDPSANGRVFEADEPRIEPQTYCYSCGALKENVLALVFPHPAGGVAVVARSRCIRIDPPAGGETAEAYRNIPATRREPCTLSS